jgi:hypothetical protein
MLIDDEAQEWLTRLANGWRLHAVQESERSGELPSEEERGTLLFCAQELAWVIDGIWNSAQMRVSRQLQEHFESCVSLTPEQQGIINQILDEEFKNND